MQRTLKLFAIVIIFLLSSVSLAQEYKGARNIALSGALHGAPSLNEAIYHNPASFAFSQRYSIEAQSLILPSSGDGKGATWIYGGSIVDTHSPYFAGGIGYYNRQQQENSEQAFQVSASKIINDYLSLGLTGKYVLRDGPNIDEALYNLDLGAFFVITKKLQMGLAARNLFKNDSEFVREMGLGLHFRPMSIIYTNLDILKNIDGAWSENVSLHMAMEVVKKSGWAVQAGLILSDQQLKRGYSLGAGWSQHKFGISYAFKNSLDGLSRRAHAFSLRVFF